MPENISCWDKCQRKQNSWFSSKLTKINFDLGVALKNLCYRHKKGNQERISTVDIYANPSAMGTALRLNETW